jgi:hypothetical protein
LRPLLDVLEPLREKPDDVLVVEGVKDLLTRAPRADEAKAAKDSELMGDGGFAQAQKLSNVAHAKLRPEDGVEDADTGRIAERLEGLGEGFDSLRIEKIGSRYLNI